MSGKREKISVTIPRELIDWIDEMVEKRVFANRSHAVEVCVLNYREATGEKG
ncbi:MAG: ribbon-helix-helix domain-containing protein [Methanomassiliicoccales archaeon]